MSLQVLVTFPGQMSIGEFSDRLSLLKEMGCHVHVDTIVNVTKKQIGMAGPRRNKPGFQVAEALTPNEEKLIDQALERIHREGKTDLLDMMTANAVGSLKPNMTKEILSYCQENPGQTFTQIASALAEKFVEHYHNVNDAFMRIRGILYAMAYSKSNQRKLEKIGRGKFALVYAL